MSRARPLLPPIRPRNVERDSLPSLFPFRIQNLGRAVAQLVEALRYKAEGRGFDSRWCHGTYHCLNPSGSTMGSTQLLTEMSTGNIS